MPQWEWGLCSALEGKGRFQGAWVILYPQINKYWWKFWRENTWITTLPGTKMFLKFRLWSVFQNLIPPYVFCCFELLLLAFPIERIIWTAVILRRTCGGSKLRCAWIIYFVLFIDFTGGYCSRNGHRIRHFVAVFRWLNDFHVPVSAGDVTVMTQQVVMTAGLFRLEGSLCSGIACDNVYIFIKKLWHIFKVEINFL